MASVLASSAMATLPPASRSPMMPDPITAASEDRRPHAPPQVARRARLSGITPASGRLGDPDAQPLAIASRTRRNAREPLLLAAGRRRGVLEAPVQTVAPRRKDAGSARPRVAHGHDDIPRLAEEAIERLGVMARAGRCRPRPSRGWRADARAWPRCRRWPPRTGRGQRSEQSFRHLAAGGVVRAEQSTRWRVIDTGLRARMNALMNLPSMAGAIASASRPARARASRASSAR